MTKKITHYRIADAFGYNMIEFAITRLISTNSKTVTLKFKSYDNMTIEMFVSHSDPESDKKWGKLYTRMNGEIVPISKLKKRDLYIYSDIDLYLSVYESQVDELNAQFAEKLEDFNTTQVEYQKERDVIHSHAEELYEHIEADIDNYPNTHPLSGSEKQIAWANEIRNAAFTSLVFDDPDNAEMRIQRTLDDPERQKAKFWIDNRTSFGY